MFSFCHDIVMIDFVMKITRALLVCDATKRQPVAIIINIHTHNSLRKTALRMRKASEEVSNSILSFSDSLKVSVNVSIHFLVLLLIMLHAHLLLRYAVPLKFILHVSVCRSTIGTYTIHRFHIFTMRVENNAIQLYFTVCSVL